MTKIKNTKKGMAKKTLSMSLVVAMLATSNVPVWASEFSAGEDVTEFSSEAEAPVVDVPVVDNGEDVADNATVASAPTTVTAAEWKINGTSYTTLPSDAGTVNYEVTLDNSIEAGRDIKVEFKDSSTNEVLSTITTGTAGKNVAVAAFSLAKTFAGKTVYTVVSYKTADGGYVALTNNTSPLTVTATEPTVNGSITIESNITGNVICPGANLKANIDKVDVDAEHKKEDLHYIWQTKGKNDSEWKTVGYDSNTYDVDINDYEKDIRVGVYFGDNFYGYKTLFTKDTYTVTTRKLSANDTKGGIVSTDTKTKLKDGKKAINLGDPEANKLTAKEITVKYKDLEGHNYTLEYGTDFTLSYEPEVLNTTGTVKVKVHILPTSTTDYTSDTYELSYELTANKVVSDANEYAITFKDAYTYNGQKQTPEVSDVKYEGKSLSANDYEVQQIGADVGSYNLVLYIKGKGYLYVNKGGKGIQTPITDEKDMPLKIAPKDISKTEVSDNLKITIPDEVWEASESDVHNNSVTVKGQTKKITVYDNAIDVTEEIKGFTIEPMNWNTTDAKKAIRIHGIGNYTGDITINGKENTRTITQFKDAFTTFFANAGVGLRYNGKLQDVLGDALAAGNGTITLQGTALTVGTNFTYEIISGGTNAGKVSVRIKGAGIYSGEMELPNVYEIGKAAFGKDINGVSDVKDNIKDSYITVSYNPSLGDKGADIKSYESLAKASYSAKMKVNGFELKEGTDYWLDYAVTYTEELDDNVFGMIGYYPTVNANTKLGRKEGNSNFKLSTDKGADSATGYRDPVVIALTAKNLHDSDIKVRVVSADYNNGDTVTPKVEVVYVENGKEYTISDDYYYVDIKKAAAAVGSKGQVSIIAKDRGNVDNATTVDSAKHPQLYTGNQVVDYVVGDATLEGGKIVATNDQTTLPSVVYDASAAATTEGITMPAKNYVVKDKSGNVVNLKYYDITYTNNKAVGTATITATGKGQYKGAVSAQFTIAANKLPSGTVTLMGDNVGKVYTGEAVELTAGTDYVVSGELGKLKLGTDYMVTYENNVNVTEGANKAKIKFVGINNYAGELVKEFDITSAQIKAENITLGDTTYAGGVAIKPSVTITVPGGKATLKEGTDYTVSYEKTATNVGETGKIVITYNKDNKNINAKDSAQTVEYSVTAKDLKDVTIAAVADQEATGEQVKPALTVTAGSVTLKEGVDYQVTYGENKEVGTGTATITPVDGNKNFTGSQEVSFNIIKAKPEVGQAMITDVVVKGNTVTPVLSGDVDGAVGYDYVIATEEDTQNGRVDISKNVLKTNTNFYYVQEGTYYAYCHAWKRDENGKKVFGAWSNIKKFTVDATTPSKPSIKSVKVKGHTVTVTFTASKDAKGYDVILGEAVKKVNGENRPVDYGKLVVKNIEDGVYTATFYNVPDGKYYAGVHSYNKSSNDGKKVFSKWGYRKTAISVGKAK